MDLLKLYKLDIYWETSTSGKISDLNANIIANDTTTPYGFRDASGTLGITWSLPESVALNTDLTEATGIYATDYAGNSLTGSNITMTLLSVTDALNNNITGNFSLTAVGSLGAAPSVRSLVTNVPSVLNVADGAFTLIVKV